MYCKKFLTGLVFTSMTLLTAGDYSFNNNIGANQPVQQLEAQMRTVMKMAEAGDKESQFVLSRLYYKTGVYDPKNFKESAIWAAKAAKQNHREAQMFLGALYLKGEGVKKDQAIAYTLFRLAAKNGEPFSIKNLAEIRGLLSVDEVKKSDKLFNKKDFLNKNI